MPRLPRSLRPIPKLANLIAEVMDKVGKDGVITVEEGRGLAMEKEYTEGMQFDRGYVSAYMATNNGAYGGRTFKPLYPYYRQKD